MSKNENSAKIDRNNEHERRHLHEVWLEGGRVAYLSDREIDVLDLLVEGLSNKQIANKLILSEHTVKAHISRIFIKLDAESRTEVAVLWTTRKEKNLDLC